MGKRGNFSDAPPPEASASGFSAASGFSSGFSSASGFSAEAAPPPPLLGGPVPPPPLLGFGGAAPPPMGPRSTHMVDRDGRPPPTLGLSAPPPAAPPAAASGAVAELLQKMAASGALPAGGGPAAPQQAILAKDKARVARALEKNLAFLEKLDASGGGGDDYASHNAYGSAAPQAQGRPENRAGLGAKGANKGVAPTAASGENCSVYVSGLDGAASESHLEALFAPHGRVKKVKVYKDDTGRPKGDALVTFAKAGSAHQAVAKVHGAPLGAAVLSVAMATFHSDAALAGGPIARPADEHWDMVVGRAAAAAVAARRETARPPSPPPPLAVDNLEEALQAHRYPVVVLRNLYDIAQCRLRPRRDFLDELEGEIRGECGKFGGSVVGCVAPKHPDYAGAVAVSFDTVKAAELCACDMNDRWFDNVQILVERRGTWEDVAAVAARSQVGAMRHPKLDDAIAPKDAVVAVLRNVYTAAEADDGGPGFFPGLEDEFRAECAKYGGLRSARAVPAEPALAGCVVLAFDGEAAYERCREDMDGRWFDYRRLVVERYAPPRADAAAGLDAFFDSLT